MADEPKGVRATLSEGQKGLFSKGTDFYGYRNSRGHYIYSNHLNAPYKEMVIGRKLESGPRSQRSWRITSFSDARYMELPSSYAGPGKHSTKNGLMTKKTWKVFGMGGSEVYKLKNLKEMVLQMTIAAHQLSIAAEHYRFVLAQRAYKVFQDSFTLKRFNSAHSTRWATLTKWTIKKRKKKKYWPNTNKTLQETNNLYKSLEYLPTIDSFTSGVRANAGYAGFHNDPRPGETYGNGFGGKYSPPKPVTRRQFMGHSTLIDDFIRVYEKAYLFDTVFRKPA